MSVWWISGLLVGGLVAVTLLARGRGRQANTVAQEPQNIYPLW